MSNMLDIALAHAVMIRKRRGGNAWWSCWSLSPVLIYCNIRKIALYARWRGVGLLILFLYVYRTYLLSGSGSVFEGWT